jgi:hypothetical protein
MINPGDEMAGQDANYSELLAAYHFIILFSNYGPSKDIIVYKLIN